MTNAVRYAVKAITVKVTRVPGKEVPDGEIDAFLANEANIPNNEDDRHDR